MTDNANAATATAPRPDPREAYEVFRERRHLAVTQPRGNLALVTTQWVTGEPEDAQTIWGVPGRWAPLPGGQSGLLVRADVSENIIVDGALVDGQAVVRGRDDPTPSEIIFSDTVTGFVIAGDSGTYALRVWDAASEAIRDFGGIDAFDYNPDWVVDATFTPIPGGAIVGFEHLKDDGTAREQVIPGEITFSRDGVDYNLAAFRAGRALQLVFGDATNGDSTYSVGRFLYVAPNADGSITLDFNRAVLPPCAFNYNFNCPIPPQQNRFAIPIDAGEKNALNRSGGLLH